MGLNLSNFAWWDGNTIDLWVYPLWLQASWNCWSGFFLWDENQQIIANPSYWDDQAESAGSNWAGRSRKNVARNTALWEGLLLMFSPFPPLIECSRPRLSRWNASFVIAVSRLQKGSGNALILFGDSMEECFLFLQWPCQVMQFFAYSVPCWVMFFTIWCAYPHHRRGGWAATRPPWVEGGRQGWPKGGNAIWWPWRAQVLQCVCKRRCCDKSVVGTDRCLLEPLALLAGGAPHWKLSRCWRLWPRLFLTSVDVRLMVSLIPKWINMIPRPQMVVKSLLHALEELRFYSCNGTR